jgi:hypothetical protein
MEMYTKTKTLFALVLVVFLLSPEAALSLSRPPGAPSIIVLEGHPEPPIKSAFKQTQRRPRTWDATVASTVFGYRISLVRTPIGVQLSLTRK